MIEIQPSRYRVEKAKSDAVLTLSDGELVRGYFFVARSSARSSGRELVGEDESLRVDAEATAKLRREAVVEVTLADGVTVSERVGNVRGTMENPMTREDIIAKTRDLMTPVIGSSSCQKLIDRVFALEGVRNILELRPLLQRA